MSELQAMIDYNRIIDVYVDDPGMASTLERGLATGALLALDSGDIKRAKAIAKYALLAQEVPFKRI